MVTREELKKTQVIVDFKTFFDNKVKIENQQNVVFFLKYLTSERSYTITWYDLSARFFCIDATLLCKFESDKT